MSTVQKPMQASFSAGTHLRRVATGLCVMAVAISIRRLVFILANMGSSPVQTVANVFNEQKFADHSGITLAHIVSSTVFIIVALIQFGNPLRNRCPRYHRVAGTLAIGAGMISGSTGIIMGFVMPSGGLLETTAMLCFGGIFLVSLVQGYLRAKQKNYVIHQQWMVRAFAVASAIVTIRIIVFLFFISQEMTGVSFPRFFGLAQWIGFSLHLAAAEWWIRKQEKTKRKVIYQRS